MVKEAKKKIKTKSSKSIQRDSIQALSYEQESSLWRPRFNYELSGDVHGWHEKLKQIYHEGEDSVWSSVVKGKTNWVLKTYDGFFVLTNKLYNTKIEMPLHETYDLKELLDVYAKLCGNVVAKKRLKVIKDGKK